jgi:kynurenine formamidase
MFSEVIVEPDPLSYIESLSNWGRWGERDQLGTLNHIKAATRAAAARLVRDGVAVSCAWDIDDMRRVMIRSAEGLADLDRDPTLPRWFSTVDDIGMKYHGQTITHLDAPAHIFWDGLAYNGVAPQAVNADRGATVLSVAACPTGAVTRGVLLDLPAVAGVEWLTRGTSVRAKQLDEAEQALGVRVRRGDAVLVRVGHDAIRRRQTVAAILGGASSGLHPSCLPWLADREVALLASDATNDVTPLIPGPLPLPVHVIGLRAMGLWLIDNADLDELGRECARRGRYEFQFTLAPLRLVGATGSPVNPIAVF